MKVGLSAERGSGSGRIPELDGMRGAAVLAVVIAHYFGEPPHGIRFLTLGWIGVDLFFVLSGFLIGGILLANRESPGYFTTFYIRRACRIFPAYYAVVAVTIAAAALLSGAPTVDPLLPASVYLTYSQNFALAILNEARGFWLLPTWTLAVEEQFYLLLPLIIYLTPPRRLLPLTLVLIASGPLFRLATMPGLASLVLLPSRWDLLFFGVLAAQVWRNPERFRRLRPALRPIVIVTVLAALSLAVVDKRLGTDLLVLLGPTLLGAFFAAYILLAVSGAPEGRRFQGRVLRFFGSISYGLYLIHMPIAGAMHTLFLGARPDVGSMSAAVVTTGSLALSVAVAWVSWLWFESPLIRFGHRWRYGARGIEMDPARPREIMSSARSA